MIELFERADPASHVEVDRSSLRAKVDDKVGVAAPLIAGSSRRRPLWLIVAVSFVLVTALFVPVYFRQERQNFFQQPIGGIRGPGIEQVVELTIGGVKSMAVDGDTIWVLESLGPTLNRIDAGTGVNLRSYQLDRYVEGVVAGGGYVWLVSYDNGGEVLRFDPDRGAVDLVVGLDGLPGSAPIWFAGSLWMSNDQSQLVRIRSDGELVSTEPGSLKGEGLGYLWVNDPATDRIESVAEDGSRGEIVIQTDGTVTPVGSGIRQVIEAGGYLWLMDDDFPNGTAVTRFDPATGELEPLTLGPGLHGMIGFNGALWVILHYDHMLVRVDPESGEVTRYPLPGKPGQMVVADSSLWDVLFHPQALIRLDPDDGLLEAGEVVVETGADSGHRLLCTAPGAGRLSDIPTILLEPFDWIDYGSWSVIQAQLNDQGLTVCANGFVGVDATPAERASSLQRALVNSGIRGPFVLVSNGDGVHATRLFAQNRDDIEGVVLVDPMPVGFGSAFADLLPDEFGSGHPPWLDLPQDIADALQGFYDVPLVVIGQTPEAVFFSPMFRESVGDDKAKKVSDLWQDGLDFYARLSTNSRTVSAEGGGMEVIYWEHPEIIVEQVLELVR